MTKDQYLEMQERELDKIHLSIVESQPQSPAEWAFLSGRVMGIALELLRVARGDVG